MESPCFGGRLFSGVRAACAFLRACVCALVMAVVGYGRCCCSWSRLVLLRFESAAFESGAESSAWVRLDSVPSPPRWAACVAD